MGMPKFSALGLSSLSSASLFIFGTGRPSVLYPHPVITRGPLKDIGLGAILGSNPGASPNLLASCPPLCALASIFPGLFPLDNIDI